jgi:beta-glucosidase
VSSISAVSGRSTAEVPTRLLAYWEDGWRYEPGRYRLRVGTSAVDLPLTAEMELT